MPDNAESERGNATAGVLNQRMTRKAAGTGQTETSSQSLFQGSPIRLAAIRAYDWGSSPNPICQDANETDSDIPVE
jgi:hypothetical protein